MWWLFDATGFSSKQVCGVDWTPGLLIAYGLANVIAGVIYQCFPLLILYYLYPRHLLSVRPALRALMIFILTCGLTHFAEAMTIFWPAYRFVTMVHWVNTCMSTLGLVLLVQAIRAIRFVPIRAELEDELELLKDASQNVRARANLLLASCGAEAAIEKLRQATSALREVSNA